MKAFFLRGGSKGLCSIEFGPDGLVFVFSTSKIKPLIQICDFYPVISSSQRDKVLTNLITQNNLQRTDCNIVLHPNNYRLLMVNAPNVPENEIKNAVKWQIKDMINFSLDDTVIDIFTPEEVQKHVKKIYVIAAQKSFLEDIQLAVHNAGLKPVAIDIREFAARNIISRLAPLNETSTFIGIEPENTLMLTTKYNSIQFVRSIPIGFKICKANNSCTPLITEMQRSLHYCDSELKLQPPKQFFIAPNKDVDELTLQSFAKELGKEVKLIDTNTAVSFTKPLSTELQSLCWSAVGGVLRKMEDS
ncbi:MAG: pilus assembly protein PilM [Gammaproteobacteria bacterium]|nr:pilus assembly protein PilM [Gammaproteobacteria bacterium]